MSNTNPACHNRARNALHCAAHAIALAICLRWSSLAMAQPPAAAEASSDPSKLFFDFFIREAAYDEPIINLAPPANSPPAADTSSRATATQIPPAVVAPADVNPPTDSQDALNKRVEALERYIQQLEKREVPPADEPLPEGKSKKDEEKKPEAKPECTPVEIITKPTFVPIGRFYFDAVTYSDDPETKQFFSTDRDNEFGFRTIRLGGRGNIWENLIYNIEVELRGTNSAVSYKDIFMEQQNLPHVGHFRAGHFKEPLGLEEFGSDLFVTFMEKSPATQAFTPGRNFGVMMWDNIDPCNDATWFAGLFRADSPDSPVNSDLWRSDNNDWSYDARLAWLPYYDEPSKGRYLTHLGGSYSFRHVGALTSGATYNQNIAYNTLNGLAEFSKRAWVGTQGPIGFGAEADSDQWNQLNGEFAVIWGAASVQTEYFQVLMNSGEHYQGGYGFLSYFLTGENRGYRKDLKTIDRVQPFEPFFWVDACRGTACGWGAWELAAGYSWVNLREGHDIVVTTPPSANDRLRGFNQDIILGLNWYQNPWARMSINYEYEITDFVDAGVPTGVGNIFGARWQIDW